MDPYTTRRRFFSDLRSLYRRVDGYPTVLSERATALCVKIDTLQAAAGSEVVLNVPVDPELVHDKFGKLVRGTVVEKDLHHIPVNFTPITRDIE